jgi:hypothetical protein
MIDLEPLDLTAVEERVLISPFQDVKAAYLDFVRSAKASVRVNIFGFHIPELTDALIERHQAGVLVDCIFDHSQAQGKAEAGELRRLMDAGVPFLIGTSPVEGQLLHAKVTVVDEEWVEDGSWNYSESATKQLNTARITHSTQLAHAYLLARDIIRAYIVRHEHIFQPKAAITPAAALPEDAGQDAALDPAPTSGQVHRQDLAAPWLDNPPLPAVGSKLPAAPPPEIHGSSRAGQPRQNRTTARHRAKSPVLQL